jgi:hypothetical protein
MNRSSPVNVCANRMETHRIIVAFEKPLFETLREIAEVSVYVACTEGRYTSDSSRCWTKCIGHRKKNRLYVEGISVWTVGRMTVATTSDVEPFFGVAEVYNSRP